MIYFRPAFNNSFNRGYRRQSNNQHRQAPCEPCKQAPCSDQPCYREEDYCITRLDELWCKYKELEVEANYASVNGLIKLREAVECIKKCIVLEEEKDKIWCEIKCWLDRYYDRFGCYSEYNEMCLAYEELKKQICLLEHEALECNCNGAEKLEESRCQTNTLLELQCEMKNKCFPKC